MPYVTEKIAKITVNQVTLRPKGFLKKTASSNASVLSTVAMQRGAKLQSESIQKWMLSAYNTTKRSSIMFPNDYGYFAY